MQRSCPQYPVVCGQVRHKFSRKHAAFPSFSRQNVWNCAQRFFGENFTQREMHREKGELWRSRTQKKGLSGFLNGQPLAMRFFLRETGGFKQPGHSRNCRLRLLRPAFFETAHGTLGDFRPGNGIVAQALLSVSRRSASLSRPQGALGSSPPNPCMRNIVPQTPFIASRLQLVSEKSIRTPCTPARCR